MVSHFHLLRQVLQLPTLLEGGRTAHSALMVPLNSKINETPTCMLSRNSAMAKVLQQSKLIVWDECTMAHKKSLEALDRTLQDLRKNKNRFGGAMILLADDFGHEHYQQYHYQRQPTNLTHV
jgi:hypothetical protein